MVVRRDLSSEAAIDAAIDAITSKIISSIIRSHTAVAREAVTIAFVNIVEGVDITTALVSTHEDDANDECAAVRALL